MGDEQFFGLSPHHVGMAVLGAATILAFWIPRLFSGREPAASALLILGGMLSFSLIPGMPAQLDPRSAPRIWEFTSELTVIVALFGTGLKIDDLSSYKRWRPTIRLLAFLMPLTISAVALLGWWIAGMTLAGGLVLGAALAPTDPVLAGDVQVGGPTEGGEHPVRFALTAEAGLNDGLTFPFLYLGLIIAAEGLAPGSWGFDWVAKDLLYRVAVGITSGAAVGWVLGRVIFIVPRGNVLADTGSGVIALAGVLFCYGLTELVEGYGFIAAFVAGLTLRRTELQHEFHSRLHDFNESIEQALTALLLIMIGGVLPVLWPELEWHYIAIGLTLIFVIRPVGGWLSLAGVGLPQRERAVIAFYGVRGIGSVYYVSYATGQLEFTNEGRLWATVAFTILASTIVHGLTAGAVVEWVTKRDSREPSSE